MLFDTRVAGIPCQCLVLAYIPPRPMEVTGPGMGDAYPPEPPEYKYYLLDSNGRRAHWLERKLEDSEVAEKLHREIANFINQ